MSNRPVCDLLADWAGSIGMSTRLEPLVGHPGKFNMIATYGEGPGLILSGHTDTVPCDPELWTSDPFVMDERDGIWFGLGSCDMKGFFVPALQAAETLIRTEGPRFRASLTLVATADEETSMDGARQLVDMVGPLNGSKTIIGEPTSLVPVLLHKGVMMTEISLTGQAGHSSNPAWGNNAIEAMHEVLGELLNIRAEWQAQWQDDRFEVPFPTLNPGCIHGGDNPNRICGLCHLNFDTRPVPGMDPEQLYSLLKSRLGQVARDQAVDFAIKRLCKPVPPFANPDSELSGILESLGAARPISVGYGTEAPFYQQLGSDTLVMGPGSIRYAHQPDERVHPKDIDRARALLEKLIHTLCIDVKSDHQP
jgi:acetylornithine deacetylase